MAESNQTMPGGSGDDGWMDAPSHEQETAPSPRSDQDWQEPQELERPEPLAEPTILAGQEPVPDDDEEVMFDDEEGIELPVSPKVLAIGCGSLALIAVIALIVVVLFVPPFNLASEFGGGGGSCKRLNANTPSLRHDDGITVTIAGDSGPCVGLGAIPRATFLEGEAKKTYVTAKEHLPSYLDMKSPLYTLKWRGDEAATIEIDIPNEAEPFNTLDLYTWDEEQEEWVFVPSQLDVGAQVIRTNEHPKSVAVFQTRSTTPLISTIIEANQPMDGLILSSLNLLLPTGLNANDDGSVQGTLVSGWQLGAGYAVVPVVRAAGNGSLTGLLNNESVLSIHTADLVNYVSTEGYNGIAIDYSAVSLTDREAFANFITELGAELDAENKLLVVVLPTPGGVAGAWDTGSYDWRAIGKAADIVILNMSRSPADYAANGSALNMLDWAVGEISRFKLHPLFSSLSATDENGLTLISYDDAISPLGSVALDTGLPEGAENFEEGASLTFDLNGEVTDLLPDQNTGAYTYNHAAESGQRHVWIVMASTIRARLDKVSSYNIGGISIADLLSEGNDAGLSTVVNEFKARSASSVPNQVLLQWTVTGASGAVLDEEIGLGTPFVWQAGDPGEYTVKADLLIGGRVSDRGSVGVQVGAAPTEETPTPTAAVIVNSGDSTPAATQSSTPPPSVGGGGDGGGFALGGQVPNSIGHAGQMQQAGMSWVKFQAKYPYVDAGTAGGFVSAGHAAGFKVLLSIPGPPYPSSIDFGGYVEHLKAVAASQPDAIEVWNEMNIDAEWPPGQIDATSYVNNMLAPAYNAIKGVSPNTMVITGALAPTGFFGGGCSVSGCDDQPYVQAMAAAGAANYANCIGVHHNAGATSPSATSGHPAGGGHYSWYFKPTIDVYYYGMGGSLPVCLTEFGYLSGDGYGALPDRFNWAATNTVQNQADWLAEGVTIAKSLGYVRLMIVWNVDFTNYESDPQAGYAIIRPDGSCPACTTLGAAMGG